MIVALSAEQPTKVAAFVHQNTPPMPYIIGSGARETFMRYGVSRIPRVLIIDPNGQIAWMGTRPIDVPRALDGLLAKYPAINVAALAERRATRRLERAESLLTAGRSAEGHAVLEQLHHDLPDTHAGRRAAERLRALPAEAPPPAAPRAGAIVKPAGGS